MLPHPFQLDGRPRTQWTYEMAEKAGDLAGYPGTLGKHSLVGPGVVMHNCFTVLTTNLRGFLFRVEMKEARAQLKHR